MKMVRMSVLRNLPVICDEKRLGLLQSISLDTAQKRVRALIVSCGMRSKRVVLPEDVISIADGFILVSRAQKYKRTMETAPCLFVRDTTGLLCGCVTDYAIDEKTLTVDAIEIIPGYLPTERRHRLWAFSYECSGGEELSVPSCLGSELDFSREGSKPCVCPP